MQQRLSLVYFSITYRTVVRCLKILHDTASANCRKTKSNTWDFTPLFTSVNDCKQISFGFESGRDAFYLFWDFVEKKIMCCAGLSERKHYEEEIWGLRKRKWTVSIALILYNRISTLVFPFQNKYCMNRNSLASQQLDWINWIIKPYLYHHLDIAEVFFSAIQTALIPWDLNSEIVFIIIEKNGTHLKDDLYRNKPLSICFHS